MVSFPCGDMDFRSNYMKINRSYTYGCMCPYGSLMNKLYQSGLDDVAKRNFLCEKRCNGNMFPGSDALIQHIDSKKDCWHVMIGVFLKTLYNYTPPKKRRNYVNPNTNKRR